MSSGVAVARKARGRGGQLEFPYYLIQMARSRSQRTARRSLAKKLARYLHVSERMVLDELLPIIRVLFAGDGELRVHLTAKLGLDEREVALLLDEAETSHAVKHLLEQAAQVAGPRAREPETGRLQAFDEDESDTP
jgi:hypothetical protein